MKPDGKLHKLRHTFGARLAMSGADAKTIQEFMGHADLTTTMRYLHLTPAHKQAAIRRLEFGDILETAPSSPPTAKAKAKKSPASRTMEAGQVVTPTGLEPMLSA